MKTFTLTFVVSLSLVTGCKSGGEPQRTREGASNPAPAARKQLPTPEYLAMPARDAIAERMRGHADEMSVLLWAVLFLDHHNVAAVGEEILARPQFTPAKTGEVDPLRASLPPTFFELQAEMMRQTKAMIAIARQPTPDPVAMAGAYGSVTQTCVRCHAVYLYSEPSAIDASAINGASSLDLSRIW